MHSSYATKQYKRRPTDWPVTSLQPYHGPAKLVSSEFSDEVLLAWSISVHLAGAEVIRLTCHWFHSLLQRRKTLTSTQHKHARASATPQRSLGASALLSEKCRFWLSRQWEALRESYLTEREEAWKWTLEREKDVFTNSLPLSPAASLMRYVIRSSSATLRIPCRYFFSSPNYNFWLKQSTSQWGVEV